MAEGSLSTLFIKFHSALSWYTLDNTVRFIPTWRLFVAPETRWAQDKSATSFMLCLFEKHQYAHSPTTCSDRNLSVSVGIRKLCMKRDECSGSCFPYTANEGPVKLLYNCVVPIYVIPEMKLLFPKQNCNVLSPGSYTHIYVRDLYISRIGLPILLQGNMWTNPGNIYKSFTDTWMWKLGLRPRNSQKRNK